MSTKFLYNFSMAMSIIYILAGLYLLLGPYFLEKPVYFSNSAIVGGAITGYGLFRLYRSINQAKRDEN